MRSPLLCILMIMKLLDDTVSDDQNEASTSADGVHAKMMANPRYYHDFCDEVDYQADETIKYLSNRIVSGRFSEKIICFYNISAPAGKRVSANFTHVKLYRNEDDCGDRLIVYDQFGKTEEIEDDDQASNYTSQGEYFLFAFVVCEESTRAAFKLSYTAVPAKEQAHHWSLTYDRKCGQRNYVAKPEVQKFTTKIDKSRSGDGVDHFCLYNITAPAGDRVAIRVVSIEFKDNEDNCRKDFVRFFDTDSEAPLSICTQEKIGNYTSTSDHFTFIMSRDGFFLGDGITLQYKIAPKNRSFSTKVTGTWIFIALLISSTTDNL